MFEEIKAMATLVSWGMAYLLLCAAAGLVITGTLTLLTILTVAVTGTV